MLGVTGPNEYENNVNNNWYTNHLAAWCLKYAAELVDRFEAKVSADECDNWKRIAEGMCLPQQKGTLIRLQQDGFLDKDLKPASALPEAERPINQVWSWDRILRSCFIKQADVLQGFYFFPDDFSEEELKANFDFYEPMTVHESSLSPCVHSILAAKLGREDKALEMYLRTSRLDLDDYNAEAYQGLHITSHGWNMDECGGRIWWIQGRGWRPTFQDNAAQCMVLVCIQIVFPWTHPRGQGDEGFHHCDVVGRSFFDGECQRRVPRGLTAWDQSAQVLLSLPGEPPNAFEPTQASGWLLSQLSPFHSNDAPMPSASLVQPLVSL